MVQKETEHKSEHKAAHEIKNTTSTPLSKELNRTSSSKKIKTVFATAFVLGLVAVGAQGAFADQVQTTSTNSFVNSTDAARPNPMAQVVSAIASKFNLNPTDVQTVVDGVMQTQHTNMQAKMQADSAARIKAAVTAGTLTQAKADLITAKIVELQAARQNEQAADKNLTPQQRKANMTAQKTALDAWATANGLSKDDLKFLAPGGRGPGMGGFGPNSGHNGHKGFGGHKATSTSSTTTQ